MAAVPVIVLALRFPRSQAVQVAVVAEPTQQHQDHLVPVGRGTLVAMVVAMEPLVVAVVVVVPPLTALTDFLEQETIQEWVALALAVQSQEAQLPEQAAVAAARGMVLVPLVVLAVAEMVGLLLLEVQTEPQIQAAVAAVADLVYLAAVAVTAVLAL